ncbi:MAG: DUF6249 domain-containing protein [Cyclobacteriaceae bacterium]
MDDGLRDVLMPVTILGGFGGSVYFFTKVITDYIVKKKMIEKGYVNEETQAILRKQVQDNKDAALKWGLIIMFGGLALMLMEFIPTSPESPLPYGLLAFSISLGFLIYYFLMKKESKL